MLDLRSLWNHIIVHGGQSGMTEQDFLETEINRFLASPERQMMITGAAYYKGSQDIQNKEREIIGANGGVQSVYNLPNARIVDNQFAKLVDQKANFLLSKQLDVDTGKKDAYSEALGKLFDVSFCRRLKNVGKDALKGGIAWIMPWVDDAGALRFRRFPSYQILPFWADDEHTELDAAARVYTVTVYEGRTLTTVTKVEYYTKDGVKNYVLKSGKLFPDNEANDSAYISIDGAEMNWEKIPLVAFKANADEIPLISRVKCLQDALNWLESSFEDCMTEDVRNSVLVLYNYDGENLADFRRNLATYGAIKIRRDDYAKGGVEVLHIEVNAENYKTILGLLKRAIIENGRGFDAKDERLAGNPNQMNILSAYADIDLDADEMEAEFSASLRELLWFVNAYLHMAKNVEAGDVQFIFNRDMMVNTSEQIANAKNSVGILSEETVVANHPWTKDVKDELARIKKEKEEQMKQFDMYAGADGKDEGENE